MMNAVLRGKPHAGNPYVRSDELEVASATTPRRLILFYKVTKIVVMASCVLSLVASAKADAMLDSIEQGNANALRVVQGLLEEAKKSAQAKARVQKEAADRANRLADSFNSAVYSGAWRKTIEVVAEMAGTSEPDKADAASNLRFAMLYWNLGESNRAIRHMTFCVDQFAKFAQKYGRENRGVKRAQVLLEKMKRGAIPGNFSVNDITGYSQPSVLSFIQRPINDAIGAYYRRQTAHLDRLNAALDAEIDVYRKEGQHQAMLATFNAEMDYLRSVNKTFDPDNQPPLGSADREKWDECKRIYDIFCTKEPSNPSTTSTTFSSSTDSSPKPSYGESNKKKRARASIRDAGHEGVQLWEGGPYWATTNIGADKPEDHGLYFWWGDIEGHRPSSEGKFSFSFGDNNSTIYTAKKSEAELQSAGWLTDGGVLAPSHDAAHVKWGGGWWLPTYQEFEDLDSKCDWIWTTQNGVKGYVVCGKDAYTDVRIFLPCAGRGGGSSLEFTSNGYYMSSVPLSDNYYSCYFYLNSSNRCTNKGLRVFGMSVRPVQRAAK